MALPPAGLLSPAFSFPHLARFPKRRTPFSFSFCFCTGSFSASNPFFPANIRCPPYYVPLRENLFDDSDGLSLCSKFPRLANPSRTIVLPQSEFRALFSRAYRGISFFFSKGTPPPQSLPFSFATTLFSAPRKPPPPEPRKFASYLLPSR